MESSEINVKRNWLVIANAARARVLEVTDIPGRYDHVADLVHPRSRLKGDQLAGDRPGHVHAEGKGHGLGSTSYEPRTDPREREHDRFAREVAKAVNDGVVKGRCAGVTLVASDPFLGQLRSHLNAQSRKAVLRVVSSDFTTLRDDELARRVAATAAR
jgi:protein required for attachment to host cells